MADPSSVRVGFDAAALVLNRAGEYRYASALRGALRDREDVELHELWPGRRVPRTLPARIALQAVVQGAWYPFVVPRAARRAGLDVLHHPRYAVSPEPGLRVPVVITMHDVLVLSAPELFSAPIRANFRALAGPLARRAAVVLTGSQASARDIAEHLRVPGERIVVTPYGVEPRFRPAPAAPELLARLGIDGPYVACVGTLEPRKNLVTALRAFARVSERHGADVALVVVGGRGWRNEAFEEELRRVQGRVILTGFLSDEDLVGVLAGARCFLYPSLHEGYGFPPLEAMACGTPVVTSATSSLPEVIGDAGLLVDPRDPEAVAGAVERLLTDDALHASLRHKGLARASSYTWDRCAAATVAAYRRAAA
jgi:glycosyltransferase involved in cell wall biosynthesis